VLGHLGQYRLFRHTSLQIMSKPVQEGGPVLLVFREVLPGDIRKQLALSNDASTGGGARDLRFRRGHLMTPILARMFPHPAGTTGVVRGPVRWFTSSGEQEDATIEFWRPTNAREGEVRLGQIHRIIGWEVNEADYNASRVNGKSWFYFLVLDANKTVWARLFQEENLDGELPAVRNYILARLGARRGKAAVFGSFDFVTGTKVP
jgi:hypothetical protein